MKKSDEKHSEMKDNRMVKDDHQEGISRVLQRDQKRTAHSGKMEWKSGENKESNWKQKGDSLVPRKA